jgi:hypothetical protein
MEATNINTYTNEIRAWIDHINTLNEVEFREYIDQKHRKQKSNIQMLVDHGFHREDIEPKWQYSPGKCTLDIIDFYQYIGDFDQHIRDVLIDIYRFCGTSIRIIIYWLPSMDKYRAGKIEQIYIDDMKDLIECDKMQILKDAMYVLLKNDHVTSGRLKEKYENINVKVKAPKQPKKRNIDYMYDESKYTPDPNQGTRYELEKYTNIKNSWIKYDGRYGDLATVLPNAKIEMSFTYDHGIGEVEVVKITNGNMVISYRIKSGQVLSSCKYVNKTLMSKLVFNYGGLTKMIKRTVIRLDLNTMRVISENKIDSPIQVSYYNHANINTAYHNLLLNYNYTKPVEYLVDKQLGNGLYYCDIRLIN